MKHLPETQSRRVLAAWARGRSDAKRRTVSVSAVPYKDRERQEAWIRGYYYQRDCERAK